MSDIPTLVLLRHGETDWNRQARLQGQRDIPLNDLGRAQAARNGRALSRAITDIAGYDFVASPMSRARETMEIARTAMGLSPTAYIRDDRLMELTFGDWEGLTLDEVRKRDGEAAARRDADKWRHNPPGGESYQQLAARVAPWLSALRRPTVVVAHGGIARVLRIRLLGEDPLVAVAAPIAQDKVFLWRDGRAEYI